MIDEEIMAAAVDVGGAISDPKIAAVILGLINPAVAVVVFAIARFVCGGLAGAGDVAVGRRVVRSADEGSRTLTDALLAALGAGVPLIRERLVGEAIAVIIGAIAEALVVGELAGTDAVGDITGYEHTVCI